ncbi:MAG TPA: hypothetical protein VF128_04960 [Gemmatimonadaceae bacterium]
MKHALMYHGSFEANFSTMKSGASSFVGSDGVARAIPEWPAEADGLRIGYMEKAGKRFAAVRVMHGTSDVMLDNELLIHPATHMGHGNRFSGEPTIIQDDAAKKLLYDIIDKNPDQHAELKAIRDRMPWGKKK